MTASITADPGPRDEAHAALDANAGSAATVDSSARYPALMTAPAPVPTPPRTGRPSPTVVSVIALSLLLAVAGGWRVWDTVRSTVSPARTGAPSSPAPTAPEIEIDRAPATLQRFEVVATYHHDPNAFTQGLVLADGRLFESTGLVGRSSLREVDPTTGAVLREVAIGEGIFAEGLALVGPRLIQLSWTSGVALVADRDSLAPLGRFRYEGEGWGLCWDGARLVMSDGSDRLTFRDPSTFAAVGSVQVLENGTGVSRLNELECVQGRVYANVWMTDRIVRIDPATGRVEAWIDAERLGPADDERLPDDVLNGIAFDERDGTLLLTGKRWPAIYRVRLLP